MPVSSPSVWRWPIILCILLVAATLWVWRTELARSYEDVRRRTSIAAEQMARRYDEEITRNLIPLRVMRRSALMWDAAPPPELYRTDWVSKEFSALERMFWVDPSGKILAAYPPDLEKMRGETLADCEHWGPLIRTAMQYPRGQVGDIVRDPDTGSPMAYSAFPIIVQDSDTAGRGTLLGEVNVNKLSAQVIDAIAKKNWHIELLSTTRVEFTSGVAAGEDNLTANSPVRFLNKWWKLRLQPTQSFIDAEFSPVPDRVLWGGLSLAMLTSGILAKVLGDRRRAIEVQRQHHRALEALHEVSTAISSRVGQPDVFTQLTQASLRLIDMTSVSVGVIRNDLGVLEIVAVAGSSRASVGQQIRLPEAPFTTETLKRREVWSIEDVERIPPGPIADQMRVKAMRSMLVIPMLVGDRIIGIFCMGDAKPRVFSPAELRMARLWGAQAAVIIANGWMFDQLKQSIETHKRMAVQQDALYALNAEIYQSENLHDALQKIADVAPGVVGADHCIITLATDKPCVVEVAATSFPNTKVLIGQRVDTNGYSCAQPLIDGKPFTIPDAMHYPGLHPAWNGIADVGSIIYFPMVQTGGKPQGAMIMVKREVGEFSPEQKNLLTIFAGRASAAIETSRLHQQTRRDAETQAMLLSELNHRVKNNLSGLVGLLSINEPELSTSAKKWIERAIERIRLMARAHELFVGGHGVIELAELIDQTLPSLMAFKPPGVKIVTEIDPVSLKLGPERAVSLAMALHELCCNGIVHGTGANGTLLVRARGTGGRSVSIEVVDDGGFAARISEPFDPVSVSATHWTVETSGVGAAVKSTGVGLSLVRGLVTRELHGVFTVQPSPRGGTIAKIQLHDEEISARGKS